MEFVSMGMIIIGMSLRLFTVTFLSRFQMLSTPKQVRPCKIFLEGQELTQLLVRACSAPETPLPESDSLSTRVMSCRRS